MDEGTGHIKEGLLVKKGHSSHRWKTNWFTLHEDRLSYYKKKDRRTPVGSFCLHGATVISPVPDYGKRPGVFKLCVRGGREHLLQASSNDERDVWAVAIGGVIRSLESKKKKDGKVPQESKLVPMNMDLSEIMTAMLDQDAGVKMETTEVAEIEYTNCFTGSGAIDWLIHWAFTNSREEGISLMEEFLKLGHVQPLSIIVGEAGALQRMESRQSVSYTFGDSHDVFYRFSAIYRSASQELLLDSSSESSDSSAGEISEGDLLENSKLGKGAVTLEGFLMKRGHLRKKWKTRKVVAKEKPPSLEYYSASKGDKTLLKTLELNGARAFAIDDQEVQNFLSVVPKKKKCVFCIKRKEGKPLLFQAEDDYTQQEWIKAINRISQE